MGNIKQMSTKLANMIAAGEVVERPLNIIKELVENSLDAKATKINIYLKNGGLEEIKIIDNGQGMDLEDIKLCFLPHATSKVANEYDLFRIKTLGFRGEALASIASVSEVSLTSKTADTKAYNIVYKFGNQISLAETASNVGTTIIVKKLFYNTPARLKYLKSSNVELGAISSLVDKLAISSPDVLFTLYNDDKLLFKTDGKGDMTALVGQIYGLEASKRIVKLDFAESGFTGTIYYVKPDIYRSSKNQMTYIVNNRYVKYYALNDVVLNAFKGYLPINKYPIIIIYINIEPLLIDVNIHPKKEEIKIAEPEQLFVVIEKLIKSSLTKINQVKKVEYQDQEKSEISPDFPSLIFKEDVADYSLFKDEQKLPNLQVIGFFLKTYIICEAADTLYILDQHACAERIKYEYYAKELNNPKMLTTNLLLPLKLEFTKEELIYLDTKKDDLKRLGFVFELLKDGINILQIPLWAQDDSEDIFREILKCLIENKPINILDYRDQICKQISCKSSIRANDYITKDEAYKLIEDLKQCENPYHCPHGRPTIISFSKKDLEKMFVRIA